MIEAEWLTTNLPLYMLRQHPATWTTWKTRQVRLFWCACLRRCWNHVDPFVTRLVGLVEDDPWGEGRELSAELEGVREQLRGDEHQLGGRYHHDYWALGVFIDPPPESLLALVSWTAARVAESAGLASGLQPGSSAWRRRCDDAETAEKQWQCWLIREVFGNPFQPVRAKPEWLTSDVLLLARGIYEEKAFDRMPILADALQDAGCDNVNVLDHCREPREHVRGCWVVDLLLGKD
jgi:hypothetical protein